jgi:5-methylcytosine-specific restriction protein A
MFDVGRVYDRVRDIHGPFGGSRQSGISPSATHPYVFIFTGDSGKRYGYQDGWDSEGVFHYTGEGQVGDQQYIKGNKAIRDHAVEGKELLLFESLGKGYRFPGSFASGM